MIPTSERELCAARFNFKVNGVVITPAFTRSAGNCSPWLKIILLYDRRQLWIGLRRCNSFVTKGVVIVEKFDRRGYWCLWSKKPYPIWSWRFSLVNNFILFHQQQSSRKGGQFVPTPSFFTLPSAAGFYYYPIFRILEQRLKQWWFDEMEIAWYMDGCSWWSGSSTHMSEVLTSGLSRLNFPYTIVLLLFFWRETIIWVRNASSLFNSWDRRFIHLYTRGA